MVALRHALWRALGLGPLVERVAALERELAASERRGEARVRELEGRLHESREALRERSKRRWAATPPDEHLTWGRPLAGDAFVDAVLRHVEVGASTRVLEVGPGYGRLLAALLARRPAIGRYHAVDLSEQVLARLRERFAQPWLTVELGDVEELGEAGDRFDLAWSSLTFKHLFPSIERALGRLARRLAPGGALAFDLIEGEARFFEDDGVTFVRWYRRDEVAELLGAAGFGPPTFETVQHDPTDERSRRLLVLARLAPPPSASAPSTAAGAGDGS